jgi:hypothetical protein
MPLNDTQLHNAIKQLLEDQKNVTDETEDPETAIENFATKLTAAISAYVRGGTVITNGTATSQTGIIE